MPKPFPGRPVNIPIKPSIPFNNKGVAGKGMGKPQGPRNPSKIPKPPGRVRPQAPTKLNSEQNQTENVPPGDNNNKEEQSNQLVQANEDNNQKDEQN